MDRERREKRGRELNMVPEGYEELSKTRFLRSMMRINMVPQVYERSKHGSLGV